MDKGLQEIRDKLKGFQRMTIPDKDKHWKNLK
jgi:hypothetical protein